MLMTVSNFYTQRLLASGMSVHSPWTEKNENSRWRFEKHISIAGFYQPSL